MACFTPLSDDRVNVFEQGLVLTTTAGMDLEAVFNAANAVFSVDFLQLFVGIFLLAFLASGENPSSICEKSPRKYVIIEVEYSF